jgi:predicted ArsR family transcriptional regulator
MHMTTRARILDYLRKQQTASVRELSGALALTGANIRHHLAHLEANGLIELVSLRREERGRPVNIYGLSRLMLGDGLVELSDAILHVWLNHAPEAALEEGFKSVAIQLAGKNLPGAEIMLNVRMARLIDRLNELHYRARWEAGVSGPTIIFGQCPYAAIIRTNPELCRMDGFFLEYWIGSAVEQSTKLHTSPKGYPICVFRVTSR